MNGSIWRIGTYKGRWSTPIRAPISLAFALEVARAAVEASQETDFTHLDTLGLALWKNGKKDEALGVQRKAVLLCDAIGGSCPDEKKRLAQFEKQ